MDMQIFLTANLTIVIFATNILSKLEERLWRKGKADAEESGQ